MINYASKIRRTARQLLTEGRVDLVLGFRKGSVPMTDQPLLVDTPADTDMLYWDSFCWLNLANYLAKRNERIAVVAKGCDARNIVVHILENQIRRDQLFIIGIPCKGMVDRQKVLKALGEEEPLEAAEDEGSIVVRGKGFERSFIKTDFLQDNCMICIHRNPIVYDQLMGDPVPEQEGMDRYEDVRNIQSMGEDERWHYFQNIVSPCIRCYACRDVCPLCYCPTCFVDESKPQWLGKSIDPADTMTYHLLRAFHCAGRCTDCGACERVCPMAVKVRQFNKKLERDVLELYGYEAGMSMEARPTLETYRPDDPEGFDG